MKTFQPTNHSNKYEHTLISTKQLVEFMIHGPQKLQLTLQSQTSTHGTMRNTQIIENTDTFGTIVTGYLGHLPLLPVRTAAYQDKRAQDKTTARKLEFPFRSDGLSLLQTVQPDNALAVASPHFTYDPFGRVIREDRSDGARVTTEYVYDDSQSDTNPRNGLSATSTYRMAINGAVAPPSTTKYDSVYRALHYLPHSLFMISLSPLTVPEPLSTHRAAWMS